MDTAPGASEIDPSLLISVGIGLGSLAVLLAGVAVYLLLQNQSAFTKSKYRSNHDTAAPGEEQLEYSSN
ncbi:hypothetical protein N9H87_01425 [Pontimonas sp.]|nr:hypothetical protein [Pontimonas sp.]MDA8862868.1 hypothetical protein [Pontimonas sp.]